jgi:molybdate transport system ATP-binding protein
VILRLENVRLPLTDFTLEISATFDRTITGIFGPSGAGKTSFLEVLAGIRRPKDGHVELDGIVLFDAARRVNLPPRLRRIGYVPQDLALFPHLDVRGNLHYGCAAETTAVFAVDHVAEVMEITPLLERGVNSLSGGEQQRVALARAILSAPRLLLLDEPMSSLDARLKKRLIPFLQRIRDEFRIPFIYVTHDANELIGLCDEIIVWDHGRVIARGLPGAMLERYS